ncbi:hypothetical protein BGZ99_010451 [Dissophora globulifera]|uniref:factor independent urate hydroxylase n=1 Tax=Dissophora globulifera TaxID=979702 RepID=A0A9P6UM76_9FUNG|nr:hypothetical protein BGZ99_010451 [Dissophora globulifera]
MTDAVNNVYLDKQEYGKDRVRLLKVHRDTKVHRVDDLTIRCLLSGAAFTTSYTEASNKAVVATDSIKNTCYVLAKSSKVVDTLELFAAELANHFLNTYSWVEGAHVTIIRHRWARMIIDGKPHTHSFWRDGDETRQTDIFIKRGANGRRTIDLKSAIAGLLVLKTTGSSFENFVRDEYTTLPEAKDRILSTCVDASWEFNVPSLQTESVLPSLSQIPFNQIYDSVRDETCKIFAVDESASVQATLYKMAAQSIKNWKWLDRVSYALPNRHFFAVDLNYFRGTKNLGEHADVYQPIADPSGLISGTVARAPGTSPAAPVSLPPIAFLNTEATASDFAVAVTLLFEPAPPLVQHLYAHRPYATYASLIDSAERLLLSTSTPTALLTQDEQVAIINAHPRIGAAKANLSALSLIEQGYTAEDAAEKVHDTATPSQDDAVTQATLKRLNQEYEDKYGFKFVVFVNGRPRHVIIPVMEERIHHSTREAEKKTAMTDMVAIARDRLSKLGVA